MAKLSDSTPRTFGDLRRLLTEAKDPWQPDPMRSNHEPLPTYPTGGDGVYEPPDRVLAEGGVAEFLRGNPPANPDLRAVWIEEGLLGETDEPREPRTERAPADGG